VKELIPKNDYGIFCDSKDVARIDSRFVAQVFGKQHKHVLRDIEKLRQPTSGLSEEFRKKEYTKSYYLNEQNKKQPCYDMTREGFSMLVMGYTTPEAMMLKEMYVKRFIEMEKVIADLVSARIQFPKLTAQIKRIHENPKPYHYSNECDMINKLVTGMTAKQFREARGIPKGESIRPHLTAEQIAEMDELQNIDIGLLVAVNEYETRKQLLTLQLERIRRERECLTTQ